MLLKVMQRSFGTTMLRHDTEQVQLRYVIVEPSVNVGVCCKDFVFLYIY